MLYFNITYWFHMGYIASNEAGMDFNLILFFNRSKLSKYYSREQIRHFYVIAILAFLPRSQYSINLAIFVRSYIIWINADIAK